MKRFLPVLLCLLSLSASHAAEWYPGIIHLHTQFSDGVSPPAALAAATRLAGAKFIIVTDHYDEIDKPLKTATPFSLSLGAVALNEGGPWGFAKYCDEVSRLTELGNFVAIPGAEIGAKWNPEPGNEASAHTLALGVIQELDSQMMDQYCEKLDHQQDVINKVRQWGMLPVAAHPSFLHDGRPGGLSLLGRIDYRYDKRPADQVPGGQVHYRGLAGVEMWNVDKAEQRQEDIDFYLRLIREGYRPFVTTGSDYHGYKPWEAATFGRKTWVYADDLTADGVLKAIGAGRTYAAEYGARLTQLSPLPGDKTSMDRAVIKATVEFPSPAGSEKEFLVYRDGQAVDASRQKQPAGRTSYSYQWTDTEASQGEHSYVLRVGEVLITSPMCIFSTRQPVPDALACVVGQRLVIVNRGNWTPQPMRDSPCVTDLMAVLSDGRLVARDLRFSPDGYKCIANTTFILDLTDGRTIALPGDLYQASIDGRTLLCRTGSEFSIYTPSDGRERRFGEWRSAGLSQDGSRAVLARYKDPDIEWAYLDVHGGRVAVLSAAEQRVLGAASGPDGMTWASNGKYFAAILHCTHSNANIAIYDVAAKQWVMSPSFEGPNGLGGHHAWSPIDLRLAAWTTDKYREPLQSGHNWFYEGRLILTGPPDWRVLPVTPPGNTRSSVAWSPDGKQVGVVWRDPNDDTVRRVFIIDSDTGMRREITAGILGDLAWSGDGHYLAVSRTTLSGQGEDRTEKPDGVQVIEVATGRKVATIQGVTSCAWLDNTGSVSSW